MRQLRSIISINNSIAGVIVLAALAIVSCTVDTVDPLSQRTRLGNMQVAIISSRANRTDIEFRGRVTSRDRRDSLYVAAGLGSFKHFVALRDTLTRDTVRVYYTLPLNVQFKVDTTLRVVLIYKQIESRFALLLKTKNDSLVCMIGTLLPNDLEPVQIQSGEQGFRVDVGSDMYASRNTECGREGDYNMIFSTHAGFVDVAPARSGQLQSAEKGYSVYNVANTQVIKDLGTCPNFPTEFAYMIIRQ